MYSFCRRHCSTNCDEGVQLQTARVFNWGAIFTRNREELGETLTDKQKETLEKFEDCINEMHSITERDAFSYGFRLGLQLMAEGFLLPIGEDK